MTVGLSCPTTWRRMYLSPFCRSELRLKGDALGCKKVQGVVEVFVLWAFLGVRIRVEALQISVMEIKKTVRMR